MGGNSILHATGLAQCCTARWGDSTETQDEWAALTGPNASHHNDAFKGHWNGTQGCLTHIHRALHVLFQGYPSSLCPPQHECHPGHSRELPICGLVSVNSERSFTSLTTLSPPSESLGLFQNCLLLALRSCFFNLYLPFPFLHIMEREKKNPHNVPFL